MLGSFLRQGERLKLPALTLGPLRIGRRGSSDETDRWQLRTRLALALLAVFIPIFLLVIYSNTQALKDRRESRVESLETLDQTMAAVVDGFTRDLQSFAKSTSITLGEAADAGLPISQETFGSYFQDLAEAYGVRSIFVTGTDGRVMAGTTGNVGFDISNRPYFQTLKSGADSVWSDALAGAVSGQTTLAYGRPIKGHDGATHAYLLIAFYPPELAGRLPDLPPDVNLTLIDKSGVVLYSSQDHSPQAPVRNVGQSPIFRRAAAGEAVVVKSQETPVDMDKRYGAFVPVMESGWVVGLTRPTAAIDGPIQSRFRRDILIISGVMIAGFLTMIFIAARLSRPLATLSVAAGAIARGERPVMPIAAADADVRRLEIAMDTMARTVRERESRLREQAEQLLRSNQSQQRLLRIISRLHASRTALSPVLDPEEISRLVSLEARDALEATNGIVALPVADGKGLRVAASFGPGAAGSGQVLDLSKRSPLVDAFISGEPRFFGSAEDAEDAYPGSESTLGKGIEALAVVPLRAHNLALGVLALGFEEPRRFSADDVDLVFAFSNQAAQAIHRAELFETEKLARESLERSNQAKDEFLGIIAHELRTPVTTIFGASRLLTNPRRPLPDAARNELIDNLGHESERLVRLVENLLLLARAELGKRPDREEFSVAALATSLAAEVQERTPEREIKLTNGLRTDSIYSERTTIEQVIENLLSNANKYSPPDRPIEIVLEGSVTDLTVRVLDQGPGVKAEELSLLFDSFYRSPSTQSEPGKGLGLAVCKRLIESLGGECWAKMRPGGGLEVGFHIPLSTDDAASRAPEGEPSATTS